MMEEELGGVVSCSRKWSRRLVMMLLLVVQLQLSNAQQTYVANRQLACERNDTSTLGYLCDGSTSTCNSYLTFRSQPPLYNTASSIASLLRSDPSQITRLNNLPSSSSTPIPPNTLLIIPISNCSCSSISSPSPSINSSSSNYYQHNASFLYNDPADTYFSISNNTYEGLTTCQALINQNPYNYLQLSPGLNISIPLRCACPSPNQTASGIRYLLTYLVATHDQISSIATAFGLSGYQSILDANELTPTDTIFPYTPLLIPLTTEPTRIDLSSSPPPPAAPVIPTSGDNNGGGGNSKWIGVGVGVGVGSLLLLGFLAWFFFLRRRRRRNRAAAAAALPGPTKYQPPQNLNAESSDQTSLTIPDSNSWSVSAEGVRFSIESLAVYNYRDLEVATGYFSEENRVKGQVYRGSFKGDYAAVKIMKGDVSGEINILKQINHSNIIRLSGFCVHQGNTYLVYEYADNGSLNDWLCPVSDKINGTTTTYWVLGWKERVQIACDIADALNYLHNFTNPPYIHKNLKSSNVLLDAHMRAKITNFGLARSLEENEDLQLTRHVVGTYGYMPPEYIENGLITPKMDVFALGVMMLELLSGKEAAPARDKQKKQEDEKDDEEELQLSARIREVLAGQNVREKLGGFMDAALKHEYPLDLAYSMAQLASNCVALDLNSRPSASEVLMTLSKILSSSMDWDPSDELEHSRSLSLGR